MGTTTTVGSEASVRVVSSPGAGEKEKGVAGQRNPLKVPIPQSTSKTIKADSFACLGRDLARLGPIWVGLE
jgi:hypothetical protein